MDVVLTFLIVCPLVALAGFVDAIAGGGGLISLPAFLMAGIPPHTAMATNKLSSSMGTALATARLGMQGYLKPRLFVVPVVAGLVGSAAGASLNLLVDDGALRAIMLVVIPLTAAYLLRPHAMVEREERLPYARTLALSTLLALGIGAYDGFYGPGTGTFLLLLLTSVAQMTLNDAAGTTKAINLTTNLSALVVFLANGQVWIALGLVAGVCNMAGAWVGVNLFSSKGVRVVKPLMLCVLAIFFVKTLLEVLGVV
ncbi:MAG: TSUP family transporter [Coriobacteriia bacterium]|nr:TSUP family transporter [Coriobacteriia bacterium]